MHNDGCPHRSSSGTLVLGLPASTTANLCVSGWTINANTVTLSALPTRQLFNQNCPKMEVNGLSVTVVPCTSSNVGGVVIYVIPALGVQAEGTGTSDENVTGPGSGTIIGRILHTIRHA